MRSGSGSLMLLCLASLFILSGCRSEPQAANGYRTGSTLTAIDSVLLVETAELYIGEPWRFAVDPYDGTFYVADRFFGRVVRYDRFGEVVRTYGRPGGGPGEFRAVGALAVQSPRTLVIDDYQQRQISLFDRKTGEYMRARRHGEGVRSMVAMGDTVWLGITDDMRHYSVGTWDLTSDSLVRFGPMPREYQESMDYFGHCSDSRIAPWADTVLVGFCGRNELVLTTAAGLVLDTINIPAMRRRGVPDDIVYILTTEQNLDKRVSSLSQLEALHRLPDGRVALVHGDISLTGGWPAGTMTGVLYLSILSPDRKEACIDLRVPASGDIRPRIGFRGDTLAVIDRVLTGEDMDTWVKLFPLDAHSCDAISLI